MESLGNREKEISKGCAKKHPFLYHYTTEAGLRGIIKTNSLWATYFADLNDSTEIRHLRAPLVAELSVALVPIIKEFRASGFQVNRRVSKAGGNVRVAESLASDWVDALYSTTFEEDDDARQGLCCITSFCSHAEDQEYERENGLLSQWRGYGANGGFCLVFDTAKLINLLNREKSSYFFLHLDISPVHYLFKGLPVTTFFSDLLSYSRDIVGQSLSGQRDISAGKIFVPFVTSATMTKHRGFYEEREVRLVAMAATKVADKKIKHMAGYKPEPIKNQFIIERESKQRHHISLFGKDFENLPITRIIVGPSAAQEEKVKLAREIFGNTIPIVKSATPYIGN